MNTGIKSFFTLLICMIAGLAIAGSPDITISNAGQKSFTVNMETVHSQVIYVKITDDNGVTLLNDRVKNQESFARKYNLVNLPAGEYTLSVETGAKTYLQPIVVGDKDLTIPKEDMMSVFSPAVRLNQDKLDFTLLCLHDAAVTIEIYDADGNVDYSGTTQERGSVQKRFDISNLTAGKYTVMTTVQGPTFTKVYDNKFVVTPSLASN